MTGDGKTPRGVGGVKERGINELIVETWALIDQAKKRLSDPELSENDKIRWAGVLASAIGTLNRLLWKAGAGRVDEEDLASILSKVPEKYARMVKKKIKTATKPDFSGVGQGDLVQVTWVDASISRDVVKLTNRAVATYKQTTGWFLAVIKDARYGVPHLILSTETTDGVAHDITSIPVPIIVAVEKLTEKTARKRQNGANVQWTSPLRGGGLKIITRKRRK